MYIYISHTHTHRDVCEYEHTGACHCTHIMFGSKDNFLPFYLSKFSDQMAWQTCLINIFTH